VAKASAHNSFFTVTDYFALLDEPRRPWLDSAELKNKFLKLSADIHPDRIHSAEASLKLAANERYIELNAAFQCLSQPRDRLRHFLELETGTRPTDQQRIAPELMDFFSEIANVCKDVDAFIIEKGRTVSPMLQVQLLVRAQEWLERLNELKQRITSRRDELIGEIQTLNTYWQRAANLSGPDEQSPLGRLEEIYRLMSFLDRWLSQIQERSVKLLL
jgi:DnaJ-domain-containing protein 1